MSLQSVARVDFLQSGAAQETPLPSSDVSHRTVEAAQSAFPSHAVPPPQPSRKRTLDKPVGPSVMDCVDWIKEEGDELERFQIFPFLNEEEATGAFTLLLDALETHCPNLRELSIVCPDSQVYLKGLNPSRFPHLTKLLIHVEGVLYPDNFWSRIVEFKTLEEATLTKYWDVDSELTDEELQQLVRNNPLLTVLGLSGHRLSSIDNPGQLTVLRALDLRKTAFVGKTIVELAIQLPKLDTLLLADNSVTHQDFIDLCGTRAFTRFEYEEGSGEFFAFSSKEEETTRDTLLRERAIVEHFVSKGLFVSDATIQAAAPHWTGLEHLVLHQYEIPIFSLPSLQAIAQFCKKLRTFSLNWSKLPENGFLTVAKGCPLLEELSFISFSSKLDSTFISQELLKAAPFLKNLKTLRLRGFAQFTPEALAALPSTCKIDQEEEEIKMALPSEDTKKPKSSSSSAVPIETE